MLYSLRYLVVDEQFHCIMVDVGYVDVDELKKTWDEFVLVLVLMLIRRVEEG